jgi:protein TonB
VRVGGKVQEANLIHKVMPVYPPLAKSARVQETVEFTAIIGKDGAIRELKLVRGHPLLVNAAKQAVEQWRYKPTMLNGEPVDVITDIVVNFTLSQ